MGISSAPFLCPIQHQNRLISAADVKVWQFEELIRDRYEGLVPIRH